MKTLNSFLKSRCFSQMMLGCLTTLFLLVNTACSQPEISRSGGELSVAKAAADKTIPKVASPYRGDTGNKPEGQITELYKSIQPVEGGMNNYSDVDPRQNTSKVDTKAERLVQKSSHPESRKFDGPLDAVKKELADEPISERVQRFSDNVSQTTKKTADGISQETQKGLDNMSEGSKNLNSKTQAAAKALTQSAKKTANNTGDSVRQTTDNIVAKVQKSVGEVQSLINTTDDM